MVDFRNMKLGRLPHKPELISKAPYLSVKLPKIDFNALANRRGLNFGFQLDGNDVCGDCGLCGIANGARAAAKLQGFEVNITKETVLSWYGKWGYPPIDNGVVLSDVLASQLTSEFWAEDQMLLTGAYGAIDVGDRMALAGVLSAAGWVYAGFDLAPEDMAVNGPWVDIAGTPSLGHCMDIVWMTGIGDEDLVGLATWGVVQIAKWYWVKSRIREAWGVIWRDVEGLNYNSVLESAREFANLT